ncbi:TetR/AcrR family transcriptional regulator [Gilvimarinus sp. SDUM040013]|uniref:TetR/AcrR family transcriptional regulator n=1 Tax=Gilvimarinus gilvus TaxID=3058038 RepID=A0ABU4RYC2_9GAMM|nr:TetR/AcrR family transcriptional regulator [Gilvimarinus sp. SDUM040013]MDO3386585.1 TetR/AcrR family transcriptional regulator [Gilvimarinus sp. SDUM040013]MDX6849161.1 TetR/AcrR family transcriptional regulator [Gilvimarinus sp. SDUM040013]
MNADTPSPTTRKSTYHHGNLRESLLAAALALLETDSLEALSLRSLAKRVGVSPTAVYSHFADKVELLVDIRTLGFRQLSEHLSTALSCEPDASGERRVRLLGMSYMSFAVLKPNLFDVLFSWSPDLERLKPECIEAGVDSVDVLRQAIIGMLTENGLPASDYIASVGSLSSWSLVHGLTMLVKTGSIEGAVYCGHWSTQFSAQEPESQQRVFEHLMTIEIEGIKAAAAQITP